MFHVRSWLPIFLLIALCTGAFAATPQVATYTVPDLSVPLAKKMALELRSLQGVMRALPIVSKQLLEVEFQPAATDPQAILAALAKVQPATALAGVKDAPAAGCKTESKCKGCPMKGGKCPEK